MDWRTNFRTQSCAWSAGRWWRMRVPRILQLSRARCLSIRFSTHSFQSHKATAGVRLMHGAAWENTSKRRGALHLHAMLNGGVGFTDISVFMEVGLGAAGASLWLLALPPLFALRATDHFLPWATGTWSQARSQRLVGSIRCSSPTTTSPAREARVLPSLILFVCHVSSVHTSPTTPSPCAILGHHVPTRRKPPHAPVHSPMGPRRKVAAGAMVWDQRPNRLPISRGAGKSGCSIGTNNMTWAWT